MSTHVQQVKQVNDNGRVMTRTKRVDDNVPAIAQSDALAANLAARIIW